MKASMTLLEGFGEKAPWTLLSLEFFVAPLGQKKYIGMQRTNEIFYAVAEKLRKSETPLVDLYNISHKFCVTMEMDILIAQAKTLLQSKRIFSITDVYYDKQTSQLHVYYWKAPKDKDSHRISPDDNCLSFVVENNELKICHTPQLTSPHDNTPITFSINPSQLSLERLLLNAVGMQINHLLMKLLVHWQQQKSRPPPLDCVELVIAPREDNTLSHLAIRFFDRNCLRIFVSLYTGRYILKMNSNFDKEFLSTFEESLNSNPESVSALITQLCFYGVRYFIEQMAIQLRLDVIRKLSNVSEDVTRGFSENVIFLKYRELNIRDFYLVVDIDADFKVKFALLSVKKEQNQMKLQNLLHVDATDLSAITFSKTPAFSLPLFFSKSDANSSHSQAELKSQLRSTFCAVVDVCRLEICTLCLLLQLSEHSISQWREVTLAEQFTGDNEKCRAASSLSTAVSFRVTSPPAEVTLIDTNQLHCGPLLFGRQFLRIYKFIHSCEPLLVSELTLLIYDGSWKVIVPEIYHILPYQWALHTEGHIRYLEKDKSWLFSYNEITRTCFKDFLVELAGLCSILSMLKQYHYFSNEPATRALCSYFKLKSFSSSYLIFTFGEQGEHVARIVWKREHGFLFNTFPIAYALANFVNIELNAYKNLFVVMQALYNTFEPLQIINKFVLSPPPKLLPGDFIAIPRSLHHLRLVYRNMVGIDIRFLGQGRVAVEDAGRMRYKKAKDRPFEKIPTSLHEMRNFTQLVSLSSQQSQQTSSNLSSQSAQSQTNSSTVSPTSPEYMIHSPPSIGTSTEQSTTSTANVSSAPSLTTVSAVSQKNNKAVMSSSISKTNRFSVFNSTVLINHHDLEFFLSCFHKYVGYLSWFYQSHLYKLDVVAKSDNTSVSLIFRTELFQISFTISDFVSGLDISFEPLPGQQTPGLDTKLQSSLITYFREKVAIEPYRIDYFLSFLNIVALPLPVLIDVADVIELEKCGARDKTSGSLYIEIPLSSATITPQTNLLTPSIVYRKSSSELQILVHIYKNGQLLLALPLLYNFKTHLVTVLNAIPNDPRIMLLSEVTTMTPTSNVSGQFLTQTLATVLKLSSEQLVTVTENLKKAMK
jgi:hypothetical protein